MDKYLEVAQNSAEFVSQYAKFKFSMDTIVYSFSNAIFVSVIYLGSF